MPKVKHHKCRYCEKDSTKCYSPDIDIKGICFCEDHKNDAFFEYYDIIGGYNIKSDCKKL